MTIIDHRTYRVKPGKFIEKAMALLDSMENKILRPTPFFTVPARKGP